MSGECSNHILNGRRHFSQLCMSLAKKLSVVQILEPPLISVAFRVGLRT